MSEPPGSSSPHRRWGESASPEPADQNTDPGRPHPYESLYRGHESGAPGGVRPTPRHYIPSSSRPDGAEAGYGWLYREADPTPPPTVETERPPATPAPRRSRRALVIILVLVLGLIAGIATGVILYRRSDRSAQPVSSAQPSTRTAGGSSTTPYAGALTRLAPTQIAADCQAPSAEDAGGRRVAYGPGKLTDQQPSTAWRCDGDGVGHRLTFTFPAGSRVGEVGLINGYPKVDPTSGAEHYAEYRRITAVTWTFGDGTALRQSLTDGDPAVQSIRIPVQASDRLIMTIDTTTKPGLTLTSRNAVLIAEVAFGTPA